MQPWVRSLTSQRNTTCVWMRDFTSLGFSYLICEMGDNDHFLWGCWLGWWWVSAWQGMDLSTWELLSWLFFLPIIMAAVQCPAHTLEELNQHSVHQNLTGLSIKGIQRRQSPANPQQLFSAPATSSQGQPKRLCLHPPAKGRFPRPLQVILPLEIRLREQITIFMPSSFKNAVWVAGSETCPHTRSPCPMHGSVSRPLSDKHAMETERQSEAREKRRLPGGQCSLLAESLLKLGAVTQGWLFQNSELLQVNLKNIPPGRHWWSSG